MVIEGRVIEVFSTNSIHAILIFITNSGSWFAWNCIEEINVTLFVSTGITGASVIKILSSFFVETTSRMHKLGLFTFFQKLTIAIFSFYREAKGGADCLSGLMFSGHTVSFDTSVSCGTTDSCAFIIRFDASSMEAFKSWFAFDIKTFSNACFNVSFASRFELMNMVTERTIFTIPLRTLSQKRSCQSKYQNKKNYFIHGN